MEDALTVAIALALLTVVSLLTIVRWQDLTKGREGIPTKNGIARAGADLVTLKLPGLSLQQARAK